LLRGLFHATSFLCHLQILDHELAKFRWGRASLEEEGLILWRFRVAKHIGQIQRSCLTWRPRVKCPEIGWKPKIYIIGYATTGS
jgi:hypothetical protein